MISEDIQIKHIEREFGQVEIKATLDIRATVTITPQAYKSPNVIEYVEDRLKKEILNKIYGEVCQNTVTAYRELQEYIFKASSGYYGFPSESPREALDRILKPLFNAGL